MTKKRLALSL